MKKIYLHIDFYNGDKFVLSEFHNATMDKDYIYFDKFKIKKSDTEDISNDKKSKIIPGRINRLIKVYTISKKKDSRFIPV